jgi:hypothetical protein
MILYLLAGLLPAVILVGIGLVFRPASGEPDSHPAWAGFLAVSWGLLLVIVFAAYRLWGEAASWMVLLLLPVLCALPAELLLHAAVDFKALFRRELRGPAVILLADLLLLAALAWFGEAFIVQAVLAGSFTLAIAWLAWDRSPRWRILFAAGLALLLLNSLWATDSQSQWFTSSPWLATLEKVLVTLAPSLAVIALARLLAWALAGEPRPSLSRWFLAGLLAMPLLALLGAQAALASGWDVATDGLGGVWLLEVCTVFAIAAGMLLAWRLPVPRRTPAFVLAVVIAVVISVANQLGTFGFDGAWGSLPPARTARRAEAVNQAILRYHASQGEYPQTLNQLTPGYLLYVPKPFIIPGQEWCYQGGGQSYRLGYVYRQYFSSPAAVKVHAAAGESDLPWGCEAEAARYQTP